MAAGSLQVSMQSGAQRLVLLAAARDTKENGTGDHLHR